MNICICGGAGYIGTALANKLAEAGENVKVIDTFMYGDNLHPKIHKVEGDLWKATKEDFAAYDRVIFLAGVSNDPMAEFDPQKNFRDNTGLPTYIAFCAKEAGVERFIYASTCSVYGFTNNIDRTEEDRPAPHFPYGISKLIGEKGCLQLADENYTVVALRKGTVCGYSPRMRYDLVINTMTKCAMNGKIRVNNPDLCRPILDIRDAVQAYWQAIFKGYVESGAYNISSENVTIGELAQTVADTVYEKTGKVVEIETHHEEDLRNYKVSRMKAATELHYVPNYSAKDTCLTVLAHLEDLTVNPDDDIYHNINVLKKWKE